MCEIKDTLLKYFHDFILKHELIFHVDYLNMDISECFSKESEGHYLIVIDFMGDTYWPESLSKGLAINYSDPDLINMLENVLVNYE